MHQDNLPGRFGLKRPRHSFAPNSGLGSSDSARLRTALERFVPRFGSGQLETDYPLAILAAVDLENALEAAVLEAFPETADNFRDGLIKAPNEYASFFVKLYVSLALEIISEDSYNNIDVIMDIARAFREDDNLKRAGFQANTIKCFCSFLIVPPEVSAYNSSYRFAFASNAIATEIASFSGRQKRSAA
ncbi:MAG: hypothetical protein GY788_08785 [bacterium]|nr:hypothetical protein [bacterium]